MVGWMDGKMHVKKTSHPLFRSSLPPRHLTILISDSLGHSNESNMDTKKGIGALIPEFISRLRFPLLFIIFLLFFIVDLALPDFIPFVDEIFLGLLTAILSRLRKERTEVPVDSEQ
tara:strand:- start:298 stop:645 length:348 start_codon:yes stop_codon:yes gene_type:complete